MRHHYNYHCFINGHKIIKQFKPGEVPNDLWVKGNGPLSEESKKNIVAAVKRASCGIPKSPEQRAKMSAASKGKPKSAEHRKHMSEAHQRRNHGTTTKLQE